MGSAAPRLHYMQTPEVELLLSRRGHYNSFGPKLYKPLVGPFNLLLVFRKVWWGGCSLWSILFLSPFFSSHCKHPLLVTVNLLLPPPSPTAPTSLQCQFASITYGDINCHCFTELSQHCAVHPLGNAPSSMFLALFGPLLSPLCSCADQLATVSGDASSTITPFSALGLPFVVLTSGDGVKGGARWGGGWDGRLDVERRHGLSTIGRNNEIEVYVWDGRALPRTYLLSSLPELHHLIARVRRAFR